MLPNESSESGTSLWNRRQSQGVPVPPWMLQEIVRYYSKSEAAPKGVALDKPFVLPNGIREIQTATRTGDSRSMNPAVRRSGCWVLRCAVPLTYLQTPLQYLKGVGPRRGPRIFSASASLLIEDLLYRFPLRYEDRARLLADCVTESGAAGRNRGPHSKQPPTYDTPPWIQNLRGPDWRRDRIDCRASG